MHYYREPLEYKEKKVSTYVNTLINKERENKTKTKQNSVLIDIHRIGTRDEGALSTQSLFSAIFNGDQ